MASHDHFGFVRQMSLELGCPSCGSLVLECSHVVPRARRVSVSERDTERPEAEDQSHERLREGERGLEGYCCMRVASKGEAEGERPLKLHRRAGWRLLNVPLEREL